MTLRLRFLTHSLLFALTTFALPAAAQVTFSTPTTYASGGQGTSNVLARDLNGDGKPDLVVVNPTTNNLGVLLNSGTGVFPATATTYASGARVGGTAGLAVGDINNDGWPDLVTANGYDNTVGVLLNSGTGTFAAPATTYPTGASSRPVNVALGDVNSDGRLDIVTANLFNYTVGVLLGQSTGGFAAPVTYSNLGYESGSVTVGDINRDGKLDILMGSLYTNVILGYHNDGRGGFAAAPVFYLRGPSGGVNDIDLVDVNNDGFSDIIGAIGGLLNIIQGTATGVGVGYSYDSGRTSIAKAAAEGDVNLDGRLDVVAANASNNTAAVFLNAGNADILAGSSALFSTGATSGPTDVAIADVNGDTKPDIITANATSGTIGILLNISILTTATPVVAGVSPSSGVPGTVVTITGTNLAGTTGVTFNGVPTTSLTVTSSNSVTAYVPVGATTGAVQVVSPTSAVTSPTTFTVTSIRPDVAVSATPAGPLSGCSSPTLTAAATLKPFLPPGTGLNGTAFATVVQPDGKILVAGYFDRFNGVTRGGVLRLNADGTLDATFAPTGTGLNYDVRTMALQADGKVLVGGYFTNYNGTAVAYLARLNADGTLDTTFRQSGTGFDGFVQEITVQPNGKILVGGNFTNYNSNLRVALARLNADGTLDTGFVLPGSGIVGTVSAIIVQPDSKLLIGGYLQTVNNVARGSIIRLNADGSLDATFTSTNGVVNSTVLAMVRQPDGKIVAGGGFTSASGAPITLGRLAANGTLDRTFAMTGFGFSNSINTLALQPDGRVVVGGIFTSYNGIVRNRLARINADGTLDTSFAPTGAGPGTGAEEVALQPDGKVVVVGSWTNFNGVAHPRIVRVTSDGTLDETPTPAAGATYVWSPGSSTGATVVAATTGGTYQATATVAGYSFSSNAVTVTACTTVPLAITAVSPGANTRGVGRLSPVQITFNQTLASSSAAALKVYSAQRGGLRTTASPVVVAGSTLTYTPAATLPFWPGETVRSTITTAAAGTAGNTLARPRVLQFTAAVGGTGTGNFSSTYNVTVQTASGGATNPTLGDVDNDGDLDLLTTSGLGTGTVNVRLNNGSGTFSGSQNVVVGSFPTEVALADVDGDGNLDLLAVNSITRVGSVSVRLNNGNGVFRGTQDVAVGSGPHGFAVGDLDGDGDIDFAVVNEFNNSVSISLNDGAGTFGLASSLATIGSPQTIITGDIDGDGDLDLIVSGIEGTTLNVLLNGGSATFSNGPNIAVGTYPYRLALGDVDSDGDLDLLAANNNLGKASTVSVRLNNGTGTFSSATDVAVGVGARDLKLGDVDADGDLDLVVANYGDALGIAGTTVSVRLNNGTGRFSAPATNPELTVNSGPFNVQLGDVDNDGDLDLLASNSSAIVNVRLNGITPPPVPTITSFSPASGIVGTLVTVTGTGLTGASAVTLNGVAVPAYSVVNATTLTFSVPAGSSSGAITITTPGGTASSATPFAVLNPVPVLSSISPNRVLVNSGSFTLTVNGTGFVPGSVINFLRGPVATTFVSSTQLTASIPSTELTGLAVFNVTVTSPTPGGGASEGQRFEIYLPAPTIADFTPTSGPVGTTVTVTGTNFQLVNYVGLAAQANATFTIIDASTLTFVVPAGAVSGPVSVRTASGTATSAATFTVIVPNAVPVITSLSPSLVEAGSGGFNLVIEGSGFLNSSVVRFNGLVLATTYTSATQLTAQVPASAVASAGSFGVTVTSPAPGGGTSAAATFTVTTPVPAPPTPTPIPVPTLMALTPASGLVGTTVTVTGTNLTGATAVLLNGGPVGSFTVVDAATLTFVVPVGATSGLVAVTTPGGTATSPGSFTVVLPTPTITNLTPNAVVAGSSDFSLVVNGTGFLPNSVVTFNATALATTYGSATQLTAQVPAAAVATVGTYGVTVANPSAAQGGTSASVPFQVITPAPALVSFTPSSGLVGTTVTVMGTNLAAATAVTLNGASVSNFTVINATTLTFVVPASATSGLVTVTTPGGTTTSATPFTVVQPNPLPTLASLSPSSVVAGSPAFILTVTGTGFSSGSVATLDGAALATTYQSATQLTAAVPASAVAMAGSYGIAVTSPTPGGGTTAELALTVTIPAPVITSFTPASGLVGTTVTMLGANFNGATALALNGVAVPSFTVVSAAALSFVVPAGSSSGLISLTTPGGTATSSTSFTVIAPNPIPSISSLTPASAVAGSRAITLTINGRDFLTDSEVSFAGTPLATTYSSPLQLTALLPATALVRAGSYDVLVTNPLPGGGTSAPVAFTVTTPAPTLVSFSPASGLVGTLVTVTGTNLADVTTVTLNGLSVGSFTVVDATSLTFVVPAGATSGLLTITTPGGTATSSSSFTVLLPNPLPTLASLSPSSVVAGSPAFTLTLTGTNFVSSSVVQLAGANLPTYYQSATQLTAEVPASAVAVAGSYGIAVANPGPGGGATAELPLVVTVPVPTITSFTPASGLVGTTVTVLGTHLNAATALMLNGLLVSDVTVASATTLSFVVPAGASSGLISVVTPGGMATSATAFTVILPNPTPTITSLTPATAVAGSGSLTLTLTGSGFLGGSVVSFAGTSLSTAYVSATQLTATLPAGALGTAGTYEVLVTNPAPGGGISAPAPFTVTTPAPTLVSFTPGSGLVGTSITLTGTNLLGTTAVSLNGVSVGSFTVANATTLTFTVPVGATSGAITVTTPGGTAISAAAFTVLLPTPTIANLTPGSVVAGSAAFALTVTGTGFVNGSVVSFGNTVLSTTYGAPTQLTAQVPASLVATAGPVSVVVENPSPAQGGASAAVTFTITAPAPAIPAPTLLSFTPASGLVGTAVTVTGTNLTGTSTVTLNGSSVSSFTVVDDATLTFVVPATATSGLLGVTTLGGTATSAGSFTVLLPNPAPLISNLSPSSAAAGSGAVALTVTGTGYVSSSAIQFNGVPLPTTFLSATQLTATIPATALATAGTYAVTVANPVPGGGSSPSADFTVTTPAPTLVSFSPASGPVGTLVTVTGTNLLGATTVTLNGASVGSYSITNATSLTLTVPAGATSGPIAMTTLGGTATSLAVFTVIVPNPAPALSSLSPSTIEAGSNDFTLALTGTGFSTGSVVLFNGAALATTYVSATQLTAQVLASAVATAGSYDVIVRNPAPGGGSSAALPFGVTAPVPTPTISSFTPTSGGTGTLVTVTGTNLLGATQVRIGSVLIPTFTVVSATSLTLVVPASSGVVSGYLTITTPGGTATSATVFSVVLATTTSQAQAQAQLQVYPNPFHSNLTIVVPGTGPIKIMLRDVTGRVVLPLTPLPTSKQLDLPSDLPAGVYLLEVRKGDATTVRRLVKQ
ncbi:IPT/TIG domain-containing protein [Hymenobacter bucti]|uniref:IPT/TIG domain-containing protein n=1 Tax=Hymenobacter bucti TaxID=1844114 RepID=A0ABW4QVZ9_9BACT